MPAPMLKTKELAGWAQARGTVALAGGMSRRSQRWAGPPPRPGATRDASSMGNEGASFGQPLLPLPGQQQGVQVRKEWMGLLWRNLHTQAWAKSLRTQG
jgi:hypothetical protein